MKKIITLYLPLFLIYNCGSDWPKERINQVTSECMDDGYSQTQCDCAVAEYQKTFSYLEMEAIFKDLNPSDSDVEKVKKLMLTISNKCGFLNP